MNFFGTKMRYIVAIALIIVLVSCAPIVYGPIYTDLVNVYGDDGDLGSANIKAGTFSVTSNKHRGIEAFHGTVRVRASIGNLEIEPSRGTKKVKIPAADIHFCAMTCFGVDDPWVDFLVPKTGSNISIKGRSELLDWCWNNRKPIVPGDAAGSWMYSGGELPSPQKFSNQLSDRKLFDEKAQRSCLGY